MQAAIAQSSNHSELRQRVLAYLDQHTTLSVATYGPAGLWVASVLYVHDGTDLYFTSVAATRHSQNMMATGRIAGTITVDCNRFEEMKGVQLEGTVVRVEDFEERRRVVRAYLSRFPFCAALWNGETSADVIGRDPGIHHFWRITPTRLLFMDLGNREELV